jgi:hypothetical protein
MSGSPVRALPSIADMAIIAKKASAVAATNCSGTPGGAYLPPGKGPRLAILSPIFLCEATLFQNPFYYSISLQNKRGGRVCDLAFLRPPSLGFSFGLNGLAPMHE